MSENRVLQAEEEVLEHQAVFVVLRGEDLDRVLEAVLLLPLQQELQNGPVVVEERKPGERFGEQVVKAERRNQNRRPDGKAFRGRRGHTTPMGCEMQGLDEGGSKPFKRCAVEGTPLPTFVC